MPRGLGLSDYVSMSDYEAEDDISEPGEIREESPAPDPPKPEIQPPRALLYLCMLDNNTTIDKFNSRTLSPELKIPLDYCRCGLTLFRVYWCDPGPKGNVRRDLFAWVDDTIKPEDITLRSLGKTECDDHRRIHSEFKYHLAEGNLKDHPEEFGYDSVLQMALIGLAALVRDDAQRERQLKKLLWLCCNALNKGTGRLCQVMDGWDDIDYETEWGQRLLAEKLKFTPTSWK